MKGYSFIKEIEQIFKKEKRNSRRGRYNSKFKVERVNMEKVDIEIIGVDISISGIGFMSNFQFKLDDVLEISFKYNNVTIPAIIKVQHVDIFDYCFFIGGQFMALQNSYRHILKELV